LVDLEVQIFDDQNRPEPELRERDAEIGNALRAASASRAELLAGWVHALRGQGDARLPGRDIEHAYRRINAVLAVLFLLVGFSSAWGVLQFSGGHPINVFVILGIFVLAQLLAVGLALLSVTLSVLSSGFFENRPLVVLVRASVLWLWRKARAKLPQQVPAQATLAWLRGRRSLYRSIERRLLFVSLQYAGLAFNVGVLSAFAAAVTFTDLAFGWSTTLRIGAEELHRACEMMAAPWASWFEQATASMSLIQATQYSHLEGAYLNAVTGARGADPTLYGQWWPFLVASIVAYGLLPRSVLMACGTWSLRKALKHLPPDTPEIQHLVFRLTSPAVRRRHSDDPGNVAELGEGYDPVRQLPRNLQRDRALCTRWREAEFPFAKLEVLLQDRYGLRVEGDLGCAGGHDYEDDQAFLRRVAGASDLPVFVIAEPWADPDRAFRRFLSQLRQQAGKERWVNVVLTQGDHAEGRSIWAGYLAELTDPYLALDRSTLMTTEDHS
jgi:hypothetical protein